MFTNGGGGSGRSHQPSGRHPQMPHCRDLPRQPTSGPVPCAVGATQRSPARVLVTEQGVLFNTAAAIHLPAATTGRRWLGATLTAAIGRILNRLLSRDRTIRAVSRTISRRRECLARWITYDDTRARRSQTTNATPSPRAHLDGACKMSPERSASNERPAVIFSRIAKSISAVQTAHRAHAHGSNPTRKK